MLLSKLLPKRARVRLKGKYKQARSQYLRARFSFSPADFAKVLEDIGVSAGGLLLVHSSMDAFEGFTGKAQDIVGALRASVGEDGHLLMPNQPFRSSVVEYAKSEPIFDVRRTPSAVGLLTELYRRSDGVVRSVHPTHPVAIAGPRANQLVHDAHKTQTPCGRGSVYERFDAERGQILLLGVSVDTMTYYHFLEEELEPIMPFSPFTAETYAMRSRCYDRSEVETKLRLFDARVSAARDMNQIVPFLRARNGLIEEHVARLVVRLVPSEHLRAAAFEMADDNQYCYEL